MGLSWTRQADAPQPAPQPAQVPVAEHREDDVAEHREDDVAVMDAAIVEIAEEIERKHADDLPKSFWTAEGRKIFYQELKKAVQNFFSETKKVEKTTLNLMSVGLRGLQARLSALYKKITKRADIKELNDEGLNNRYKNVLKSYEDLRDACFSLVSDIRMRAEGARMYVREDIIQKHPDLVFNNAPLKLLREHLESFDFQAIFRKIGALNTECDNLQTSIYDLVAQRQAELAGRRSLCRKICWIGGIVGVVAAFLVVAHLVPQIPLVLGSMVFGPAVGGIVVGGGGALGAWIMQYWPEQKLKNVMGDADDVLESMKANTGVLKNNLVLLRQQMGYLHDYLENEDLLKKRLIEGVKFKDFTEREKETYSFVCGNFIIDLDKLIQSCKGVEGVCSL